jgi:hypothetical protein
MILEVSCQHWDAKIPRKEFVTTVVLVSLAM